MGIVHGADPPPAAHREIASAQSWRRAASCMFWVLSLVRRPGVLDRSVAFATANHRQTQRGKAAAEKRQGRGLRHADRAAATTTWATLSRRLSRTHAGNVFAGRLRMRLRGAGKAQNRHGGGDQSCSLHLRLPWSLQVVMRRSLQISSQRIQPHDSQHSVFAACDVIRATWRITAKKFDSDRWELHHEAISHGFLYFSLSRSGQALNATSAGSLCFAAGRRAGLLAERWRVSRALDQRGGAWQHSWLSGRAALSGVDLSSAP